MKTKTALLAMALLIAIGAARPGDATDEYHFALAKSAPEADAAVPSPEEVRLWFTEPPEDNSIAIRVITPSGDAIETGETTPDAEDGRVFSISIADALAAGTYTVAWRGIGADGHVARGDFEFLVTTH